MATNTTSDDSKDLSNVPTWFLGVDGEGREHHITVGASHAFVDGVDGAVDLPEDTDLVDYGLHVVDLTGATWEEINLDPPAQGILTGERMESEE